MEMPWGLLGLGFEAWTKKRVFSFIHPLILLTVNACHQRMDWPKGWRSYFCEGKTFTEERWYIFFLQETYYIKYFLSLCYIARTIKPSQCNEQDYQGSKILLLQQCNLNVLEVLSFELNFLPTIKKRLLLKLILRIFFWA